MTRHEIREELRAEVKSKSGESLLLFIEGAGFVVNRIEPIDRNNARDYLVFLGLNDRLRRHLGVVGDELLLVALHADRQQQWFIPEARKRLRDRARLSKTAALVVSADDGIVRMCRTAFVDSSTGYKTAFVAFTHELLRGVPRGKELNALVDAFAAQAFSVDHFDTRAPVPDDLFGREAIAMQVEADVRSRQEGVALLGIRRVGKTSILKKVIQQLVASPDDGGPVGYYDAQSDTVDASADRAANELVRGLAESCRLLNLPVPPAPNVAPIDRLKRYVDGVASLSKVTLAIDEVEWLLPISNAGVEAEAKGDDYLRLFGALRAMKQKYPERVRLIVCGINERFCEQPRVNNHENPCLDWFHPHYVGLMTRPDTLNMLRELAARMGASLGDDFANDCWDAFGGHAYLSRQFCSQAMKAIPSSARTLSHETFVEVYPRFASRAGNVFEAILRHLASFYHVEYEMLRNIARGADVADGSALNHLINYGLIARGSDGRWKIPLRSLREFVSSHTVEEVARERFKLLAQVGHGASATVWRAWDSKEQRDCAVKLFAPGVDSAAIREEYEVLKSLGGGVLPEVFGVFRVDDRDALVMELVAGRNLRKVLAEQSVVPANELATFGEKLLTAVAGLHPQSAAIAALRQKRSLTEQEFDNLQRLAAEGYLHRDLKPENIIVRNESVWDLCLVDLHLARPAEMAGYTRVGTPAYSAPDLGVTRWNPTFDLFACGCILFEAAFGSLPDGTMASIVAERVSDSQYRDATVAFFSRALAKASADRFQSAGEMLGAWKETCVALL